MNEKELDSSNVEYSEKINPERYAQQLQWYRAIGLQKLII